MAKVNASVTVPADPERTWATASDLSRFDEWLVLHDGWRGEVPAELTAGSRLTSVVTVMGLRNRISWLVESVAPPHALRLSGRGVGGVTVSLRLSVRDAGPAHTTVGVDAEITGPPVFGPIGMAIGRAVRADMRRSVAAFAGLLS